MRILAIAACLFLLAMLVAGCATVPPERGARYSNGRDSVELFSGPCTDSKVIAHLPQELRDKLKAGHGTYDGKPYALCWIRVQGGIVVVWEDGGMGQIPDGHAQIGVGV